MEFRVLALGDVTSEDGTRHLARTLRPFQKVHGVDFTVVNGENVSGVGLTRIRRRISSPPAPMSSRWATIRGAKCRSLTYLEDSPTSYGLPTFSPHAGPWRGSLRLRPLPHRVISLIGRCDLSWGSDNPFTQRTACWRSGRSHLHGGGFSRSGHQRKAGHGLLSGRPGLPPCGDPTHVPTADQRVFPKGTGYLTDLGMTGAVGVGAGHPAPAVGGDVLRRPAGPLPPASGPCKAQGRSSRWTAPRACVQRWSGGYPLTARHLSRKIRHIEAVTQDPFRRFCHIGEMSHVC